jgi:hypothetical protein
MKKSAFGIFAFLFASLLIVSCKKDPTFEEKIVGAWKSLSVKASGVDVTASNQFNLTLKSDSKFDLEVTYTLPIVGKNTQTFTGTWTKEAQDDTKITLKFDGSGNVSTLEISALDEDSMTSKITVSNVQYEVQFLKK